MILAMMTGAVALALALFVVTVCTMAKGSFAQSRGTELDDQPKTTR